LLSRVRSALVLLLVSAMPVSGAKFPAAVEKTVTLSGDAAVAAAALFGLSTAGPGSVSLPLGRGVAWAVYLLKQDTAEPLYNDEHMPPRRDMVGFSAGPTPTLTIAPFWLALATSLPNPQPGHYSIGSDSLPVSLPRDDPWSQIARRLKAEPGWRDDANPRATRCFEGESGTELCFSVAAGTDYPNNIPMAVYVVGLVARPK
jgi:hypothetical protein